MRAWGFESLILRYFDSKLAPAKAGVQNHGDNRPHVMFLLQGIIFLISVLRFQIHPGKASRGLDRSKGRQSYKNIDLRFWTVDFGFILVSHPEYSGRPQGPGDCPPCGGIPDPPQKKRAVPNITGAAHSIFRTSCFYI